MIRLFCLAFAFLFTSTAAAQSIPTTEPAEEHKLLQKDVGQWTGTMKMAGPDGQPMELPVTETNTSFGNDLWVLTEFSAGPFQGRGQYGYDTRKKKYIGTWIDNSIAHMSMMEGEYDKSKKAMVMMMKGIDHATGEPQEMKTVTTWEGDDKRHFVMYAKNGDQWQESFEIHYERKK